MIPGQPAEAPVVHYVPTRCLTPDAARQLARLDLAPVEDLSERHVLDSSISRLRAYISLYQAKITSHRAPKTRADYESFFRIWFRFMYDKGHKRHRQPLPVYLPTIHPTRAAPVRPPTAYTPLTPQSDPGYLKLRPLSSKPPGPVKTAVQKRDDETPIHPHIATLLRTYGLFGRAWTAAGDAVVLSACEFLSSWGPRVDKSAAATEHAAAFCDHIAALAAQPLLDYDPQIETDVALATLRFVPVLSGGTCWRLMRNDRSSLRTVGLFVPG